MNDGTQLALLAVALLVLLLWSYRGRTREPYIDVATGQIGWFAPADKRVPELGPMLAEVAEGIQDLGCASMGALLEVVGDAGESDGSGRRLPCGKVTDALKKYENELDARVQASGATPATKAKFLKYGRQAMDTVREAFKPMCKDGTFDPAELRDALTQLQTAFCRSLPTPAADAAAKPAGVNDPRLTAAVQKAQKALKVTRGTNNAVAVARAEAALNAAKAALMAANIAALKGPGSSLTAKANAQAAEAAAEARKAEGASAPRAHANAAEIAARALEALYRAATDDAKTTKPPKSTKPPKTTTKPPKTTKKTTREPAANTTKPPKRAADSRRKAK